MGGYKPTSELDPEEAERRRAIQRERLRAFREANPNYFAEWREKNRAKVNENARKYRSERWRSDPEWREKQKALSRRMHHKFREQRLEVQRSKRQADHEARESDNARRRNQYHANWDREQASHKAASGRRRQRYPWETLLRSAEARAKKRGLEFSLTRKWAEARWTGFCEVSGLPFVVRQEKVPGPKFFSPSIDQIRPKGGYTPDNCRFVIWAVNALKHDGTDEDMMLVVKAIYEKNLSLFR